VGLAGLIHGPEESLPKENPSDRVKSIHDQYVGQAASLLIGQWIEFGKGHPTVK